jgi:hypothetical protein
MPSFISQPGFCNCFITLLLTIPEDIMRLSSLHAVGECAKSNFAHSPNAQAPTSCTLLVRTGVYILENTPPPCGGGKISAYVIWGKKYEKGKRKRG